MSSEISEMNYYKAIELLIILVCSGIIPVWLFCEGRKETKKLEKKLEKEIIARKNSESEKVIEIYKNYLEEAKGEKRKLTATILRLRNQLENVGNISWSEHEIDDQEKREEAILAIKNHWDINSKNEKINNKNIIQVLGENWENNFYIKTGYNITKELERLKKIINEENPEKEEKNNWSSSTWLLILGVAVAKIGYDYYYRQNGENDKEKKPSKSKQNS